MLALVTVIATGRHLGDAGFGEYQTLVNYVALVSVIIDLGFNTLYMREGARFPSEIQRYLRNVLSVKALLAVACFVVLAAVLVIPGLESLLIPGFVMMVLSAYANLLRNTFYALQRLAFEAIAIALESIVLLALVLFGIRSGQGVAYFIWAYAASYGFACIYFVLVLLVRRIAVIGWRLEPELVRRWFWAGLPFALTFVITTIYFKVDVPILWALRPHQEVGWYSLAYKPFEALLFVPVTMLNVVFPVLSVYYRESPDRVRPAVNQFFRTLALVGWPITVGTFMLTPGLNGLLHLFPQSEPALRILALGILFMFVSNTFIAALNAIDKQGLFTIAAAASLVINVGLNVILIPTFGYRGAAAATVLTEVGLTVMGYVLVARHLGPVPIVRLGWRLLLAGIVMGLALYPFRGVHGWATVAAVAGAAALYCVCLVIFRAVDRAELRAAASALRLPFAAR